MADIEKQNGARTAVFEDSNTAPPAIAHPRPIRPASPDLNTQGVTIRRKANPGPLGLMSFASTTFILSMVNVSTRGVAVPNIVIGMALFTGGLAQLLAGMWEFGMGNTFGATAFTSYGAFWMSYATILIPGSGITAAYEGTGQEDNAIGIFLVSWFIFTFLLTIAAARLNFTLLSLFFFLTLTFLMLSIAQFSTAAAPACQKAGGALGLITSFIAWYCAMGEFLTYRDSWFTLPLGQIPKRID